MRFHESWIFFVCYISESVKADNIEEIIAALEGKKIKIKERIWNEDIHIHVEKKIFSANIHSFERSFVRSLVLTSFKKITGIY